MSNYRAFSRGVCARCVVLAALMPPALPGAQAASEAGKSAVQAPAEAASSARRVSPYLLAMRRHAPAASGVPSPVSPLTLHRSHRMAAPSRQP